MMADVYEHDVTIHDSYESGCLAAMYLAKMSLGMESNLSGITKYIGKEKKYQPNKDNYKAYRKLIPIFIRLSRELSKEYESIADYQREFSKIYKD